MVPMMVRSGADMLRTRGLPRCGERCVGGAAKFAPRGLPAAASACARWAGSISHGQPGEFTRHVCSYDVLPGFVLRAMLLACCSRRTAYSATSHEQPPSRRVLDVRHVTLSGVQSCLRCA